MYVRFHNPIYKFGDDVAFHLREEDNDPFKALARYAKQLETGAEMIRRAAALFESAKEIELHADTHFVGAEVPDELGQQLIDANVAEQEPLDEDEDGNL